MLAYALRRILLMVPTLFAIIVVNFFIIQAAPGGPVDQMIAQLKGRGNVTARVTSAGGELANAPAATRASRGIDPALLARLNKLYGFDKPPGERFWIMIKHYVAFDFGTSFFSDRPVIKLIADKLPVSISLGSVDHAARLSDFDSARHCQGGARRLALRRLDQRRRDRGLRHSRFPVRDPAGRAVRRRQLSPMVSVARPRLRRLVATPVCSPRSSTISGTSRCRSRRW